MALPAPYSRRTSSLSRASFMSQGSYPDDDSVYMSPGLRESRERWATILRSSREGTRQKAVNKEGASQTANRASPRRARAAQPRNDARASSDQEEVPDDDLTCPQCNKHFKNKRTLATHARQVHIGTRCYWPECTHVADSTRALNQHLHHHNHTIPTGRRYRCNWPGCRKGYASCESLARHLRQHNVAALNVSTEDHSQERDE
ncbi:hypothetical protein F5Y05DRAFT_257443 [Hypoxylon sp. FL0543]|nr:hypothetical protein F5Y05DRAFT_257443 [Hypoxylon sp. FL0543]